MAFPTTGVLDQFTRTDAADLGANWSVYWSNNRWLIISNQAAATSLAWYGDYWDSATFGPDAEVYVKIVSYADHEWELDIRVGGTPGSSPNSYAVGFNGGGAGVVKLYRVDGGSGTQLGASMSQTLADGDSIGLEAVGSTITVYHKPAAGAWASVGGRTDATYGSAGYIALSAIGQSPSYLMADDFGGGTVVAGEPPAAAARLAGFRALLGVGV